MITGSVIIPTHNRRSVLLETLDCLGLQSYPSDAFEVIVVADGCMDGTIEALRVSRTPFHLRVLEQSNGGPGAARNAGAAAASGHVLIFLDDDIQVEPGFVEAHVKVHCDRANRVGIGYLPPDLRDQTGYFRLELWQWWQDMFDRMRQPGHRFAYIDLLSGNFSLTADLFDRMHGFDATLRVHEDYELGARLLKAGVEIVFVADAVGWHGETADISRALVRKFGEGKADVQLGRLHPELRKTLVMAWMDRFARVPSRVLRGLALRSPATGDFLARLSLHGLGPLEAAGQRLLWRRALYGLLGYWYWRGVIDELPTAQEIAAFLSFEPSRQRHDFATSELDLAQGLTKAEERLDQEQPAAARIRYGPHYVGWIPPQAGAELLRGSHLRPYLWNQLAVPLLEALGEAGVLPEPITVEELHVLFDKEWHRLADWQRARGQGESAAEPEDWQPWEQIVP